MEYMPENLETIRIERKISLEKLSKKVKIHTDYLIAIEQGSIYYLDLAPIYKKNFIKAYTSYFDIDPTPMLERIDSIIAETNETQETPTRKKGIGRDYTHNIPQLIRSFILISITATLLGYLGFQIKHILEPPRLSVFSPEDGYVTNNNVITVKGETEPEVTVFINGEEIKNNSNGGFSETITLNNGLNTLTISAQKKHGKNTVITKYVTVTGGTH